MNMAVCLGGKRRVTPVGIFAAGILCFGILACTETYEYPQSPEEVLTEYLSFDSEGGQLTKAGIRLLERYTSRSINPGDPPSPYVIMGYDIQQIKISDNEATAAVRFDRIGIIEQMHKFTPSESATTIVTFKLTKRYGKWKVTPLRAHVLGKIVIDYLEKEIKETHDSSPEWRSEIEQVIKGITASIQEQKSLPDARHLTAEEVVKQYLMLSAKGAHLSGLGRRMLHQLTRERFNEQSITVTHLITGYRIAETPTHARQRSVVSVEYDVIGHTESFVTFREKKEKFKQVFELKKLHDRWEIQTPVAPFVSWETVVEHLRAERAELAKLPVEPEEMHKKGIAHLDTLISRISLAAQH